MMNATDQLAAVLWEADRHIETLADALVEWDKIPVTDMPTVEADRGHVRLTDQLLFRFIKLQDALGERLVPVTLTGLAEPFEDRPLLDRLNRLEKLGFLDVDNWLAWREVRNRLEHEYPDRPELRFAALLAAIEAARGVAALYRQWRQRLETSGLLNPGRPQ